MTVQNGPLAGVFPKASEDQWRKAVDKALKGGSFEKLVAKTYDGAAISPLYPRAASQGVRALRKTPGRWAILGRVDLADPDAANRLALEYLEGGADGLHLVFAGSAGAYGGGLTANDSESIAHLLDKVRLDYAIPVAIETSTRTPNAVAELITLLDRNHIDPSITRISLGYDPLGAQLLHGFLPKPWAQSGKDFAASVQSAAKLGYRYGTVAADARLIHGAGGSETQELAFALASGLAYLRALADNGVDIETARGLLIFRLAADADEFQTVAKFRALRRLWARVEEACGLKPVTALIHAETAWRMMSRRDPWNNLLRATLATFSASVGGADAITVIPFTQPLGAPDSFAHRLARDTQLVLQDESHVHVVDDPAAGAGGFEALTEDLCHSAWAAFQQIEADGGLAAALEKGAFQGRVAEIAGQRAKNVARAKDKITGANEFPDIGEVAVSVLAPFDESRLDAPAPEGALRSAPLKPRRLSEPFERLRDASDAALAAKGARPRVFLANLGSVASYTARANFAKNFFEAGGVEAVFGPQTDDVTLLTKAFRESGAKVSCLCSSDQIYCDAAETVVIALKDAGASVYLAGRPGELESQLRKAGVRNFIYAGCDMFDLLQLAFEEAK
jgi:methylmalonyl-CoA mutase